jgi:photosystem II stability/assembly factor-like uncharacterized protein
MSVVTVLYAATGNDVVKLTGNGDHWDAETVLENLGVQCVAIDPEDPHRLYAGTFDDGLFRSLDGGKTWENVSSGIPHQRFPSVAISPSHRVNGTNAVYAGTEPSSLFVSEDDGASWQDMPTLRDLPSAPTWSFPPRPWTSHVRWIALSWHDPELIFAGIELGGVMRSTDGGETWEDRKPGSYHDSHCILTHPSDSTRVYEAAGGGVARSKDAGDTWQPVDEGMDRHYVWALAVDPEDPDRWFVSASHSARYAHRDNGSSEAMIYRKQGENPWQPAMTGLDQPMREMPYALLIPRDDPATIYAGTRQGSLLVSRNRGDSWEHAGVQLDGILQLAYAPAG